MIKNREPNPLEFFNMRRMRLCPPHFEVTTTSMMYNLEDSIDRWIKENLKGRYYVGKGIVAHSSIKEPVIKIGFEEPKEASYFMLACPHLKYK
jgi:hypothetical protein